MELQDYYIILGIPRTATARDILHAYRELAKSYHPDRIGLQGTATFQDIVEASDNRAFLYLYGTPLKRVEGKTRKGATGKRKLIDDSRRGVGGTAQKINCPEELHRGASHRGESIGTALWHGLCNMRIVSVGSSDGKTVHPSMLQVRYGFGHRPTDRLSAQSRIPGGE